MSEESVSRTAALTAIFARICRYPIDSSIRPAYEDALEAIGCLPAADVVPVQRCGNCKHMRPSVDVHTGEVVDHWCNLYDYDGIAADSLCLKWAQAMGWR